MVKVRIHICNDFEYMDKRVYVDIKLPAVPRIGEVIWLGEKPCRHLENMARKNLDTARDYTGWFYRKSSGCEDIKDCNLKDLSLPVLEICGPRHKSKKFPC